METLFSMMLMQFDFEGLNSANKIMGPIFFISYILVLVFIVMNILITILNDSFYR